MEKGVKDFFQEELVENLNGAGATVVLGAVVVCCGVEEAVEGTPGEAVEDASCGRGGGSYNIGKDQQSNCCYNTAGHGHVIVTLL